MTKTADPPKVPERIYIDPTNMKAGYWWTDGEEGEIEYLSPNAVEKELREFYEYIRDYVELELTDRDESVVAKFLARKERT